MKEVERFDQRSIRPVNNSHQGQETEARLEEAQRSSISPGAGATGGSGDARLREILRLLHLTTNVLKFSATLLDDLATASLLKDTCHVAELAVGMLINPAEDSGSFLLATLHLSRSGPLTELFILFFDRHRPGIYNYVSADVGCSHTLCFSAVSSFR